MRTVELKKITAALRRRTPPQRKLVAMELASLDAQPVSATIVEGRFAAGAACPHCNSERTVRHGHANGLQGIVAVSAGAPSPALPERP